MNHALADDGHQPPTIPARPTIPAAVLAQAVTEGVHLYQPIPRDVLAIQYRGFDDIARIRVFVQQLRALHLVPASTYVVSGNHDTVVVVHQRTDRLTKTQYLVFDGGELRVTSQFRFPYQQTPNRSGVRP